MDAPAAPLAALAFAATALAVTGRVRGALSAPTRTPTQSKNYSTTHCPGGGDRPSWGLTCARRISEADMEAIGNYGEGIEQVLSVLKRFDVDPHVGFLPAGDPLQRLPHKSYQIWEDLADDLPRLLGARLGQVRGPLGAVPLISTEHLSTTDELRRAHLLLSLFAHAYVWGDNTPVDFIPEGIARPLWEVSARLQMPPILTHPSIVLYNWRRLDKQGDICMENIATLNHFFGGRDESWFYLITVEIEARGARAIVPMMMATEAVRRWREGAQASDAVGSWAAAGVCEYVTTQLALVARAIEGMTASMDAMKEGCAPFIFYHRVRPFLAGWKNNPALPHGVTYRGVSDERQQFFGGSAAQSSLLPFLDILLGVVHESPHSRDFLMAMRDYMVKSHRDFLVHLETSAGLRPFIVEQLAWLDHRGDVAPGDAQAARRQEVLCELRDAYDSAVIGLKRFRDSHMSVVHEYIVLQQRNGQLGKGIEAHAGGKGTGGTDLMSFLRPVRNAVDAKIIRRGRSASATGDSSTADEAH